MIPENYKDREQAFVKHTLLKNYLEKLFMIIGQYQKVICYIDCFAGPWQEGSESLEDTSIAISLQIMKKCKEALKKRNRDVHFRALYIEKSKKSYKRLEKFLSNTQWEEIETKNLNGDFYDLRFKICSWCDDNSFAFFFVDPTGWNKVIELETLRPLLERKNSEYLINFMYDYILRAHTQENLNEHMIRIFGEVPNTCNMSPAEREEKLIALYCEKLKYSLSDERKLPRLAHVKVLYPTRDRTLYDLVYITRNPMGIVKFMETSEELDIIQNRVRAIAKQNKRIEKSGQSELFSADIDAALEKRDLDLSFGKNYWIVKLSTRPKHVVHFNANFRQGELLGLLK